MATRHYTTLRGLFIQGDPESEENVIPPRFGLKDDSGDRWVKFKAEIERLNATASPGTQYKVVFLGRHGEGYHNVAIERYTSEEWSSCWSKLNGDGEMVWGPDPDLTSLGLEQARDANRAWKTELTFGIPLPEKLYSSPMRRAIKTNQVTFEGLLQPSLKTTIVEDVRERIGVSTCDERRKKSEIASDFPEYVFELGFTEEDEAWAPDFREPFSEIDTRARRMLDMIFSCDRERFISITTHHRFIDAFLRVCEHRHWELPTGGVLPIVLRAEPKSLN